MLQLPDRRTQTVAAQRIGLQLHRTALTGPAEGALLIARTLPNSGTPSCSVSAARPCPAVQPLARLFEVREFVAADEEADRARLARRTLDESTVFEDDDHPMHSGRSDLEVPLQIAFCGRLAVDLRVVVHERKVLPLLRSVPRR